MDKIWDRNPLMSEVIGRCGSITKPMTVKSPDNNFCFYSIQK